MKKLRALPLMLLAMITMLGCESDNPTTTPPTEETNYYLYFDQSWGRNFNGLVGDSVDVEMTVHVYTGDEGKSDRTPVANAVVAVGWAYGEYREPDVFSDTIVTNAEGKGRQVLRLEVKKGYQPVTISGRIEESSTSGQITLNGYSQPARLIITAPTHKLMVPSGQVARMNLNCQIVDSNGVGIPDLMMTGKLEGSANNPRFGGISFTDQSNSAGNVTIYYNSAGYFGTESIVMTGEISGIAESLIEGRFTVETVALEDQIGAFRLYGLPERVILPDDGEAVLVLNALATDRGGAPLPGLRVDFSTSLGVIQSSVVTDSVGFAHAVWHTGTEVDIATIRADVPATFFSAAGSVEVTRNVEEPADPVARISLFTDDLTLIAGSGGSTTLRALCLTESNRFAEPGTIVGFELLEGDGRFEVDQAAVNEEGEAAVRFIVGMPMGATRIRAFVEDNNGDRIESNDIEVRAVAGEAENIEITLDYDEISEGGSTNVQVFTFDQYRNPVGGEVVRFSSTMGQVTPLLVTDATGRATGSLSRGVSSGVAEVTWTWRERSGIFTVTFVAGSPNVIYISADPLQIHHDVGDGATTISAQVLDGNGNRITRPTTVVFQLLNQPDPPDGCTFPNDGQIDSARTANGLAVMTLRAGLRVGGVLVKAYTWRDPDTVWVDESPWIPGEWRVDTVSVVISTIQVIGGPPVRFDYDIDPRGIDAGGGIWNLTVAIRAYDSDLNPSNGEYPVTFRIEPDGVATIAPVRIINGSGRTTLAYPSSSTFETIRINASIAIEPGNISNDQNYQLPLQRGFLTLAADPQNWMFNRDRPNDVSRVRVWAVLRDGHDVVINNAPIIFSSDRGKYFWLNNVGGVYTAFFPNPVREYTGLINQNHNEPPGTATVYLQGVMNEYYLDDFTLEVNVHVEARVEGLDVVADPVTVAMTRH